MPLQFASTENIVEVGKEEDVLPESSPARQLIAAAPPGQLRRLAESVLLLLSHNVGSSDEEASPTAVEDVLGEVRESRWSLAHIDIAAVDPLDKFAVMCSASRIPSKGTPGPPTYLCPQSRVSFRVEPKSLRVPGCDDQLEAQLPPSWMEYLDDPRRIALEQRLKAHARQFFRGNVGYLVMFRPNEELSAINVHLAVSAESIDPPNCKAGCWLTTMDFVVKEGESVPLKACVACQIHLSEEMVFSLRQRKDNFSAEELPPLTADEVAALPEEFAQSIVVRLQRIENQVLTAVLKRICGEGQTKLNSLRRVVIENPTSSWVDHLRSELAEQATAFAKRRGAEHVIE